MPRSLPLLILAFSTNLCCQSLIHRVTGGPALPNLGTSVTTPGDLDGDGTADFAAAGWAPLTSPMKLVVVRAWSGRSGSLIYETTSVVNATLLRITLRTAGDMSGDGVNDLLLGLAERAVNFTDPGRVEIIDGATGILLAARTAPAPGRLYAFDVAGGDDYDLDGVPDYAVGVPGALAGGRADVVSGATGAIITSVHPSILQTYTASWFGSGVTFIGDLSGNGKKDLIVMSALPALPDLFSIPGGSQIATLATCGLSPQGGASPNPARVTGLGDLDGDTYEDLALAHRPPAVPGVAFLRGGFFSCLNTSAVVASHMARVPDADGDGLDDLAVSAGASWSVLSGATGAVLLFQGWTPTGPNQGLVTQDITDIAGLEDLNGDGFGEVVLGRGSASVVDVWSVNDLSASLSVLGPGVPVQLTANVPVIPLPHSPIVLGQAVMPQPLPPPFHAEVLGAPALAPGTLILAPVPESPFPITSSLILWPDLSRSSEWTLVPFTTDVTGAAVLATGLPPDVRLAGLEAVLQAWFPSPPGFSNAQASNGLRLRIGF